MKFWKIFFTTARGLLLLVIIITIGGLGTKFVSDILSHSKTSPLEQQVLGASAQAISSIKSFEYSVPVSFLSTLDAKDAFTVAGTTALNGDVVIPKGAIQLGNKTITENNIVMNLTAGQGISVTNGQSPVISNTGVLSVQGTTGTVAFTAGSGIAISGLQISSTLTEPTIPNAFGAVSVGGTNFSAGSSADIFTLAAGDGLTATLDTATKKILYSQTIANGLTTNGILYAAGTSSLASITPGTTGLVLESQGSGLAPIWAAVAGANPSFSTISSGANISAAMIVGSGASLGFTGTGTINASSLLGGTWVIPGAIGSTTANSGAFTTLSVAGTATIATINPEIDLKDTTGNKTWKLLTSNNGDQLNLTSPNSATEWSVNNSSDTTTITDLVGNAKYSGAISLVARGAGGQTADLQEWQNNGATPLSFVSANGSFGIGTAAIGNVEVAVNQANSSGDIFTASSSGNTKFVIANNGNIGIGTTNPLTPLYVVGNVSATGSYNGFNLQNFNSSNNARLQLANSGSIIDRNVADSNPVLIVNDINASSTADLFVASAAGVNRFVINNSGNVGIGTSSATSKLNIVSASGNGLRVYSPDLSRYVGLEYDGSNVAFNANAGQTNIVFDSNLFVSNTKQITVSGLAGANAVLYAAPSTGAFTSAITTTGNQCLLSAVGASGTPSWGSCALGSNYWQLNAGVISPLTQTNSLSIGTTSSLGTLDVRNLNGTLATASVSGATSFAGLVVDNAGTGDIFAASSSGANRFVITQNGNIGIGITNPNSPLHVINTSSGGMVTSLTLGNGSANNGSGTRIAFNLSNNAGGMTASVQAVRTNLGGAGATYLAFGTNPGISTNTTTETMRLSEFGGAGFQTTAIGNGALVVNQPNNFGDIFAASSSGQNRFVITQSGNVGIGSSNPTSALVVNGDIMPNVGFTGNIGTTNSPWARVAAKFGQFTSGFSSGNTLGSSTFFGTGTTPTATISGTTSFATLVVDNSGVGDIFTASSSGQNRFTIMQNGNISFNNNVVLQTSSNPILYNLKASNPVFNNVNGFSQFYTGAISDFGQLYLGSSSIGGSANNQLITTVFNGQNSFITLAGGNINGAASGATLQLYGNTNSTNANQVIFTANNVAINTSSPLATLDTRGNSGTLAIASFSGQTSFAALVADNSGTGDIFTASSSGLNRFVITQAGNVGIGTVTPNAPLEVDGTSPSILKLFRNGVFNSNIQYANGNGSLYAGLDPQNGFSIGPNQDLSSAPFLKIAGSSGMVSIGTTNALSTLDVRAKSGTLSIASISGATSFSGLVVDNSGTGNIFSASSSGIPQFTIGNNGSLTDSSLSGANAVLYGTPTTGLFANATTTTANQCLLSAAGASGTPTWGSCALGTNYLQLNSGLLSPANITNDLAIGGNSTASANTFFTASLGKSSFLQGSLTLGSTSTGSPFKLQVITSIPGKAAVVINDSSTDQDLFTASSSGITKFRIDVNGNILPGASGGANIGAVSLPYGTVYANNMITTATSGQNGYWQLNSGVLSPNTLSNTLSLGTTASLGTLDVRNLTGTLATASISGATSFAGLVVDNSGSGDIFTASSSGLNRFVITQNGNVGIGTSNPTSALTVNGFINPFSTAGSGLGSSSVNWNTAWIKWISSTAGLAVGTGSLSPGGGGSTAFGTGTSPTATIAANTSYAGMVVDNKGVGDLFTASTSGQSRFVITNTGNVGIGTTAPTSTLSVIGDVRSSSAFRLTGSGTLGVGTNGTSDFRISGSNNLELGAGGTTNVYQTITAAGFVGIGTTTTNMGNAELTINQGNSSGDIFSASAAGTTLFTIANSGTVTAAGSILPAAGYTYSLGNSNSPWNGIYSKWLETPGGSGGLSLGNFNLSVGTGTQPIATIAANTAFAAMVVDNKGVGDLFTASSSGQSRFVITQNGNVGIGTTTPSDLFSVVKNISGADLSARFQNLTSGNGAYINTIANSNYSGLGITGTGQAWNVGMRGTTSFLIQDGTNSTTPFTIASGAPNNSLYVNGSGNVGIGTTTPQNALQVNGNAVVYGDALGFIVQDTGIASPNYTSRFRYDSSVLGLSNISRIRLGGVIGMQGFGVSKGDTAMNVWMPINGGLGIGSTSLLGTLDVRASGNTSNGGTIAIASISGQTSFAGLVVDNSGAGDIFTASSSGLNRFVITQAGNVGIGTTNPNSFMVQSAGDMGPDVAGTYNLGSSIKSWNAIYGTALYALGGSAVSNTINGTGLQVDKDTKGRATGIINQQGLGSIFTASQAGTTLFNIDNSGNTRIAASLCVKATFSSACAGNTAGTIYASNVTVQAADYAENYISSQTLEPGDIVMPANDGNNEAVVKTTAGYQSQTIGIVSTKPGTTLNSDAQIDAQHPNRYPIALQGRVPVKVSSQNGAISAGDLLTSSPIPGVAMKATSEGQIIGKALDNYTSTDPKAIGSVMVFVNISWANPNLQIALSNSGDLNINGQPVGSSSIDTPNTPSVSTALASQVQGNTDQIHVLSDAFAQLQASQSATLGKINDLSQKLAAIEKTVNLNQALSADSTQSAVLGASTVAGDTTVNGNLSVSGRTLLADVGITGKITDGLLTINGMDTSDGTPSASINTLSVPLKIQSLATAGVDFMNGKITIDTSGNMVVAGDISAKTIKADQYEAKGTGDNPSIGEATIPAGKSSIEVKTAAITATSKIFVTSEIKGSGQLYVTTKVTGKSFTVELDKATLMDDTFNWWIVNTY